MDQQGDNHTTSAQEPATETDVLIVGAGPTGLTLACELLRRGIQCCLIDRIDEPAQPSRALDIQMIGRINSIGMDRFCWTQSISCTDPMEQARHHSTLSDPMAISAFAASQHERSRC